MKSLKPRSLRPILIREAVIRAVRAFFEQRDFHEVIPPVLNHALPLEPNLYAFSTQWQYLDHSQQLYLPTSPEAALKKMLALGLGKCFAIGKSFRNQELRGTKHNPEFLMLEWYREDAHYTDIMRETEELLRFVLAQVLDHFPDLHDSREAIAAEVQTQDAWQRLSLRDLFLERVGLDFADVAGSDALVQYAAAKDYNTTQASWSELFDQVFLNEVEPYLPQTPFFLVDFPARLSPLCAVQSDNAAVAERFEVYLNGVELGNGNTEQTDAYRVKEYFTQEDHYRKAKGIPSHPIDQEFLTALAQLDGTEKTYAGIGLGLDRLALWLSGEHDIAAVEPFVL